MCVAYPVVELWIDRASGNILKRLDFALSGKKMRTTLYPEYTKKFSPSKKADVWPRHVMPSSLAARPANPGQGLHPEAQAAPDIAGSGRSKMACWSC